MPLWRCVKFSLNHFFLLFQGLSMKTFSRVYFSMCQFLAISGRSQTQRKLNQCEKLSIYSTRLIKKSIRNSSVFRNCLAEPEVPPEVHNGSFAVDNNLCQSQNKRTVTVYWKVPLYITLSVRSLKHGFQTFSDTRVSQKNWDLSNVS